jgi:UDP-4-amino-4,6-dideoxy-N-acetyl-beta-L-altrosamine transaminase
MIPYGRQWINQDDIDAVSAVLRHDYLTQGPAVSLFEKALCDYTGAAYCVAVANGTAALHVAVAALELPPGSKGITSPNTFTASATSMVYCGVTPVFADIDAETLCVSPGEIAKRIDAETRLITPVHFAGRACDMPAIADLVKQNHLRVIEDAAHAIGSAYPEGGKVGCCRYSDMTIFSFHPVKTITTGEGGAVTTNDPVLYERLLLLRSHGITKDASRMGQCHGSWYYEMQSLGFNYRLTDIQAALGISQMKRLDEFKRRRLEIVKAYHAGFKGLTWLKCPCERNQDGFCYHLYVVRIDFGALGLTRQAVMDQFKAKGVLTQVHYIPVHTQPFYQAQYGTRVGDCPVAEAYYAQALSLPLFPAMTDADVQQVIACVNNLCGNISVD